MVKRSAVINKFKDASIQKWNDRTQIAFGKLNSKVNHTS